MLYYALLYYIILLQKNEASCNKNSPPSATAQCKPEAVPKASNLCWREIISGLSRSAVEMGWMGWLRCHDG